MWMWNGKNRIAFYFVEGRAGDASQGKVRIHRYNNCCQLRPRRGQPIGRASVSVVKLVDPKVDSPTSCQIVMYVRRGQSITSGLNSTRTGTDGDGIVSEASL